MANVPENVLRLKRTVSDLVNNWDILTEENKRQKCQEIREFNPPGAPASPSDMSGFENLDKSTQVYLLREYYLELRAKYDEIISQNQTLISKNQTLFHDIKELKVIVKDLQKSHEDMKKRLDKADTVIANDLAQCLASDLVYMVQQKNNAKDIKSLSALFPKNDEENFYAAALAMKQPPDIAHPGQRKYKSASWEHVIAVIFKDFPFSSSEEKKNIIKFIRWIKDTLKETKPFENWEWMEWMN